ncbi:MAG: hypothetical protein RSC35_03885 [Mucinivorans sp.]
MKRFFIFMVMIVTLCSCVSLKSYRATKARMISLEYERVILRGAAAIEAIEAIETKEDSVEIENTEIINHGTLQTDTTQIKR